MSDIQTDIAGDDEIAALLARRRAPAASSGGADPARDLGAAQFSGEGESFTPPLHEVPEEEELQREIATAQHRTSTVPAPGPAPAARPANPPPAAQNPDEPFSWPANPFCFKFKTPAELFMFCYPQHEPYLWQREEMYRIAGYLDPYSDEQFDFTQKAPLQYNLLAANGSGKDTYCITPVSVWFVLYYARARFIVTTSSHAQMKTQTWKYIEAFADKFNAEMEKRGQKPPFIIREFNIYNTYNGSEIQAFVTDEAGRVEGYHPFPDKPDGKMAICINEAKSIKDSIFDSFVRFTGFSHWLQISSPGTKRGKFYRVCSNAREDICLPGVEFVRRVTAFDCPNITQAHINKVLLENGEDSLIYQTSILARFYDSGSDVVIPEGLLRYEAPQHNTYNLPPVAGLDLALGGDECWFVVIHGNKIVHRKSFLIPDAAKLQDALIAEFNFAKSTFGLEPSDINADFGGLGRPIINHLHRNGYHVNPVSNNAPARDKAFFVNYGAEMWFRVKRLFEMRILIPPTEPKLIDQLTSRKYETRDDQKVKLESKPEARARGANSPDYADAYVLALARYPLQVLLSTPPAPVVSDLIDLMNDPDRYEELLMRMRERRLQKHTATQPRNYGLLHQTLGS